MSILLGTGIAAQAASADHSGIASAWDLAKDVGVSSNQISFNQGSNDVWYFMESHTIGHNPSTYRFIPEYHAPAVFLGGGNTPAGFYCWQVLPNLLPDVCCNFNSTSVTLDSGLIKFRVPSTNHLCVTQVGGGHE